MNDFRFVKTLENMIGEFKLFNTAWRNIVYYFKTLPTINIGIITQYISNMSDVFICVSKAFILFHK